MRNSKRVQLVLLIFLVTCEALDLCRPISTSFICDFLWVQRILSLIVTNVRSVSVSALRANISSFPRQLRLCILFWSTNMIKGAPIRAVLISWLAFCHCSTWERPKTNRFLFRSHRPASLLNNRFWNKRVRCLISAWKQHLHSKSLSTMSNNANISFVNELHSCHWWFTTLFSFM